MLDSSQQVPYLLRFMKIIFSNLISLQSMDTCLGFLLLQPYTYIKIILRAITDDATKCKGFSQVYCELETCALVHLPLQEAVVFVRHRVL